MLLICCKETWIFVLSSSLKVESTASGSNPRAQQRPEDQDLATTTWAPSVPGKAWRTVDKTKDGRAELGVSELEGARWGGDSNRPKVHIAVIKHHNQKQFGKGSLFGLHVFITGHH